MKNPPEPAPAPMITVGHLIDPDSEVRGVWIASVWNLDYPSRTDLSADELRAELDEILEVCAENGLNTLFFQVRPAADALYESDLFPVSAALSTSGELTFDPLRYLVNTARPRNIRVYAWVTPLRATLTGTDPEALPDGHPAKEHPEWTVAYADGKLYFNAGLPEVRQLVADGVREIVTRYDVDGVEAGTAELRFAEVSALPDPAVSAEDFAFGVAVPMPGETVPVEVTVRNLGLGTATGVTVRVWVSDGEGEATELFGVGGTAAVLDLPGGVAVTLTNDWVCDDSLGELRFTARLEVPEGVGNASGGNDEATWRPGAADLWLEDAQSVAESATVRALRATVRNYGLAGASEGTVVVFRRGAPDGEEIGRDEVGAVLAGEANGYDAGVVWDMAGGAWTGAWETVYAVFEGAEAEEAASRAAVIRVMTPLDRDGDGLLDGEEEAMGTDPLNGDTNGDGVGDWEHVYVQFTDPLAGMGGAWTTNTPVAVPHEWLEGFAEALAAHGGDFEAFAADRAENGMPVWACYLAGVNPTIAEETFVALLEYVDGKLTVKWQPDLNEDGTKAERVYRVLGKKAMLDGEEWRDVTDVEDLDAEGWRFFRVKVALTE